MGGTQFDGRASSYAGGRCRAARASARRSGALILAAAGLAYPGAPAAAQRLPEPIQVEAPHPGAAARADETRAQQQSRPRRQTRRGAQIGGLAGGAVGLAMGTFIALYCRSYGDPCDAAIPVLTTLGGVSGAVGGAIIGAAIPTEARPAGQAAPAEDRRIGSASLSLGAAHARLEGDPGQVWLDAWGPAARANVYAELRPWLGVGPEVGIASFGGGERIRHAAVAFRGTWTGHRLVPYVAANIGAYQSTGPSLEYLGGGIGAGARWQPGQRRAFIDADVRFSANIQNIEPMRMRGVYVGGGLYW
jgi:hypothetical protein